MVWIAAAGLALSKTRQSTAGPLSRIRGGSAGQRTQAWQWAQEQIDRGAMSPGWQRVGPNASRHDSNGHGRIEVFIRHAHAPLARGVLAEIRRAGAEVVSLDVEELGDLRSSFDELHPRGASADTALAGAVEELQRGAHTVAVLSSAAARALDAADVAIGLITADAAAPWHADVLVRDLRAAWPILHALPAARRASRRGVELATSASALGRC